MVGDLTGQKQSSQSISHRLRTLPSSRFLPLFREGGKELEQAGLLAPGSSLCLRLPIRHSSRFRNRVVTAVSTYTYHLERVPIRPECRKVAPTRLQALLPGYSGATAPAYEPMRLVHRLPYYPHTGTCPIVFYFWIPNISTPYRLRLARRAEYTLPPYP